MEKISIFGLILTAIVLLTLVFTIFNKPFPAFQYAENINLVDVESDIGKRYSEFMWGERWQDLIAQAFVMFTAAASCLAIFIPRRGSKE